MRVGGIHFKGEDVVRAYKNGVMIWHLVDFIFYSCDDVELFALPLVTLHSPNTWNAKKEEASIEFSEFYPLYASKGRENKSLSEVSNILKIELQASESKNSELEEKTSFKQKTVNYASLSGAAHPSKKILLFSPVEGYASLSVNSCLRNLLQLNLRIPFRNQPSRVIQPYAEQALVYYFWLLNQFSGPLSPEGEINLTIDIPLRDSASRQGRGKLGFVINNNLLLLLQKSKWFISNSSNQFLDESIMRSSFTKYYKTLSEINTLSKNSFYCDTSKIVEKNFLNTAENFLLLDLTPTKKVEKNNHILGEAIDQLDYVILKKAFINKSLINKNIDTLYTSIKENFFIQSKSNFNNFSLFQSELSKPYKIAFKGKILSKPTLKESSVNFILEAYLSQIYACVNLRLQKDKFIANFYKICFLNNELFSLACPQAAPYSYTTINENNVSFEIGNIFSYKILDKIYSLSSEILRTPWGRRSVTNALLNSYSKSNIKIDVNKDFNPKLTSCSFADIKTRIEEIARIFSNLNPLLANKSLLMGTPPNNIRFTKRIFSSSLVFLEFIEGFKAPFFGIAKFSNCSFLEFDSGLLFFEIASLVSSYSLPKLRFLERNILTTQNSNDFSHSYLKLSFLETVFEANANFRHKNKNALKLSEKNNIKRQEKIKSFNTLITSFSKFQIMDNGIAQDKTRISVHLDMTILSYFGGLVFQNKQDEYLILKNSAIKDFCIAEKFDCAHSKSRLVHSNILAEKGSDKIQNKSCSVLSFDNSYRWIYPYYLDEENTELFIYQVKNFSYANKNFIQGGKK